MAGPLTRTRRDKPLFDQRLHRFPIKVLGQFRGGEHKAHGRQLHFPRLHRLDRRRRQNRRPRLKVKPKPPRGVRLPEQLRDKPLSVNPALRARLDPLRQCRAVLIEVPRSMGRYVKNAVNLKTLPLRERPRAKREPESFLPPVSGEHRRPHQIGDRKRLPLIWIRDDPVEHVDQRAPISVRRRIRRMSRRPRNHSDMNPPAPGQQHRTNITNPHFAAAMNNDNTRRHFSRHAPIVTNGSRPVQPSPVPSAPETASVSAPTHRLLRPPQVAAASLTPGPSGIQPLTVLYPRPFLTPAPYPSSSRPGATCDRGANLCNRCPSLPRTRPAARRPPHSILPSDIMLHRGVHP